MTGMNKRRLELNGDPTEVTFEQMVEHARTIMRRAAQDAARILKEPVPELVETKLPHGGLRIVVRWPDGEETNECVVNPILQANAN